MRALPLLRVLRSTVAVSAVALGSTTAHAACTTANGVVTCTGPSTTNDANNAIGSTPPPSVSVAVAPGATVTSAFLNAISVSGFRYNGAIGYTNSGAVGTAGANVDFRFDGNINDTGNPANSFTFDNRGTQNGRISAFGVGGAISGTNSGTVTGGIDLRNAGAINFTNTGTVSTNSNSFSDAIILSSSRTRSQTDADATTRSTDTGGPVTATIAGLVGIPASGTTPVRPQNIYANSVAGVDITANGAAGIITAAGYGAASASRSTFVSSAGTSTAIQLYDSSTIGANARVTIGTAGQVAGVSVFTGPGAATAIVNGTVVSGAASSGVNVSASGINSTSRSDQVSSSGLTTRTSSASSTSTGGAALAEVSTTGRAIGGVTARSNAGSATVRIAGQVGTATTLGSAASFSIGTNSTSQNRSTSRSDGTSDSSSSSTASTSGGAALTTIAATGDVFGGASAQGDGSAVVDNLGRVRGSVFSSTNGTFGALTTATAGSNSRTVTTGTGGVRTTVDMSASNSTSENLGGAASVNNRLGGTIGGSVQAFGVGGAALDNAGTIAGSVFLSSSGTRNTSANTSRTTSTSVPATGGGTTSTVVGESSGTTSTRATGGAATGTYSGTIGMAPSANFNTFTSVQQNGATASTATVMGTLFAGFSGNAGGENRDSSSTSSSRQVTQPNGASTRDQSSTSRETVAQIASTSTLTVAASGRIAANGIGTGNVTLDSSGGDARFILDGGQVAGGVSINAGTGVNSTQTSATSGTFTRAAAAPGTFFFEVPQSQTDSSTVDSRQAPGTAIATVNAGNIGGDLFASGNGTGPGSLGANVVMNGTVTGALTASSSGVNDRSDSGSTTTATGPNAFTRTTVTNSFSSPSANAGGVLVAVGGTVGGGLVAGTDTGNSTVDLTGSVGSLSSDGAVVLSYGFTALRQTTTTAAGTAFFNLLPTSSVTTGSSTVSGGVATLNVAANAGIPIAGSSSIEGDVIVQGFAGSTLTVAAGSRIVQNIGAVTVGAQFGNSVTTTTSSFTNGVQTGSTANSTSTAVGGPAVLTNAGVIGSAGNASGVSVASVGGASVTNTGTINGSITAAARGANRVSTSTTTNLNSFANRRTVTTSALTAVGGPVQVNNASLVTGGITAVGATGTVTNSGVVRGGVTLGASFDTFTTTSTTTNMTTNRGTTQVTVNDPSVPNATLFTQTYTLNQNGLARGGINVTGATTVDPSDATVRTSNVNATVNLNNGSITLGTITADRDTTTNVNLNGSGFLGVAANDTTGPAVPGTIVTGFQPTPSLVRFTAIDPALGTTVPLPSGSRVSGVQTLTKAGDGTFVIVGAPLLAGVGTASPTYPLDVGTLRVRGGELLLAAVGTTSPAYTLDVGTLRVNGGELQLGLAGATATANSFGIRGNVENNADLVVGRRITNGTQTAIQGINVSVVGNVTNTSAGNLIVGINPALVRANAPAAGTSPFAGTPAPFVALGATSGLPSTNSFVRVDGDRNRRGSGIARRALRGRARL